MSQGFIQDAAGTSGTSGISDIYMTKIQALGSSIIAESIPSWASNSTLTFAGSTVYYVPIYIPSSITLTGVKTFIRVQGVFAANANYNGMGLYSYVSGNLSLLASTVSNGNLWASSSTNTFVSSSFSASYVATRGVYYLAFLWNRASQTTAPAILAFSLSSANQANLDLFSGATLQGTQGGQATLPASVNMSSSLGSGSAQAWGALY